MDIGEVSAEFNEAVTAKGMPSAAWPIGFLVGLGVLVAFSMASSSEVRLEPRADTGVALPISEPAPHERSAQFDLVLPVAGDVVLGSCVPVAGRVTPPNGRSLAAQPASVTVVVLEGDRIVGEGKLPVANGTFVGWLAVESPSKGRRVELLVSFTTHPTRERSRVSFILAAKSTPTGAVSPVPCHTMGS